MMDVGSPIGERYIKPNIIEDDQINGFRQVVSINEKNGQIVATQHYGLIDSNIVKNFRNRLTTAVLRIWNNSLGRKAIKIIEHPWLPRDMPYTLYFGMAMFPLTAALAASLLGGTLTAQEFESGTILEYRMAPIPVWKIICGRILRLTVTGLISTIILLIAIWFVNDIWPNSVWKVILIVIPVGIIAGSLGIIAGVLLQKSIPAFLVGLVYSFVTWLLGSAFGLAAGFSRAYEIISRFTPNTHALELLYPLYYRVNVGTPIFSIIFLILVSLFFVGFSILIYYSRVLQRN
jgi:ABC-type multidrug transport system permease subunit